MDEALKQTILSSLNVSDWLSKFLFEADNACKTFDELGYQTFGLFFIKQLCPDCLGGRLKGLIYANYFVSFDYQELVVDNSLLCTLALCFAFLLLYLFYAFYGTTTYNVV